MIAIDDQRPLGDGRVSYAGCERRRERKTKSLRNSLGDNVFEEPNPEQGRGNTTNGRGHHMRNRGCDLDGHQTCDAHEETENTLHAG